MGNGGEEFEIGKITEGDVWGGEKSEKGECGNGGLWVGRGFMEEEV